jgi:ABC-type glycerol-3-phosphate transport system permease component
MSVPQYGRAATLALVAGLGLSLTACSTKSDDKGTTAGGKVTITVDSVGIYSFAGGTPMNVVIAASVIAAIPTVIVFLIFQRNIMSGLTAGSIKG